MRNKLEEACPEKIAISASRTLPRVRGEPQQMFGPRQEEAGGNLIDFVLEIQLESEAQNYRRSQANQALTDYT